MPIRSNNNKRYHISLRWKLRLAVIALIILGGWLLMRNLTAPQHGKLVDTGDSAIIQKDKSKASSTPAGKIESKYFTLDLPKGYRPQTANQNVPGLLYAQTIIKPSSSGSILINISIKALPEGGLEADTAYKLRQQQSARYKLSNQTVDGELVHIANDIEKSAIVAFWAHGGYLATVSVASGIDAPAANDNTEQIAVLRPILQAWQWR